MNKPNYYIEAFKEKFNIFLMIFVLIMLITGQNFGIYGFLLTSFIALSLETIYIIVLPRTKTYKSYINRLKGYKEVEIIDEPENKKGLPQDVKNKYNELEKKYKDIKKILEKNPNSKHLLSNEVKRLEYLLETYQNFSVNLANYKKYLLDNNSKIIETEIKDIKSKLKRSFDNLSNDLDLAFQMMQKRKLLKENLIILEKRLTRINQLKGTVDKLQAQVNIIEDTFNLISDHIISFSPGEVLSIDIDDVVKEVEKTSQILDNTYKEMDKLKKINKLMH